MLLIFLVLKVMSAFYVCSIYLSALQARFYHEGKLYEPDQTALKDKSDMGPYYLQYRLPKYMVLSR